MLLFPGEVHFRIGLGKWVADSFRAWFRFGASCAQGKGLNTLRLTGSRKALGNIFEVLGRSALLFLVSSGGGLGLGVQSKTGLG